MEELSCSIEHVVAKLLAVQVPPPGSSMLRFSIGAADKQAIQTPLSDFLPVTTSSVAMLLRQLGEYEKYFERRSKMLVKKGKTELTAWLFCVNSYWLL